MRCPGPPGRRTRRGVLTTNERYDVEELLAIAASGALDRVSVARAVFRAEADVFLRQAPVGSLQPDELARLIVAHSLASRWTCDPALLALVLDYLITTKGHGRLAPLLDRVRRKEDPNPDPYEAAWLM